MSIPIPVGILLCCLSLSNGLNAQSLTEIRVPALSATPDTDALVAGIEGLQARQLQLQPIAAGIITAETSPEELRIAVSAVQSYISAATDVVLAAAALTTSETEPPLTRRSVTLLMQGQMDYLARVASPVGIGIDSFYQSLIFADEFSVLDPELRVDLVGVYVSSLLADPAPTDVEQAVLVSVDDEEFARALANRAGSPLGVSDLRAVDWDQRIGETIEIQYFDEAARLVDRTVTISGFDPRFGLIIPAEAEDALPITLKLSRIEFLRFTED